MSARTYEYDRYSTLAGDFADAATDRPHTVEFVRVVGRDGRRGRSLLLAFATIVFEVIFLVWLLQPSHLPYDDGSWRYWVAMSLVASIGVIETMRLVNVITLARATWQSHDPIPVAPEPGTRVAFLTTIVPGKEPIEMAEETLHAALRVRHDGLFDVWLLDEGNDPAVKAMCARLGVNHYSRKGIPELNQATGRNRAKTKHGNYNAWLDKHGDKYDFWVSVDTDHVPLENFAERLLGYFRDPDVAFVVGPQVYGNTASMVSRLAESQQYLFHGVLQRAGNRHGSAMFVGTNNAVRISALKDIDGLADSITEDAATSLVWHSQRNKGSGQRWKSVYTPDVLAVGEGPTSWTDYFIQQNRWARGTNEVVLRKFVRYVPKLPIGRAVHYALLMSYYPSAAIGWVLGCLNLVAYLLFGIGGVTVSAQLWAMLYLNAAFLQVAIYFWNRRYNVSPHEEEGSSGVSGMFVSALSAPMYVTALTDAIRGRNVPFQVTAKGEDGSPDRLATFRKNNLWGVLMLSVLVASLFLHTPHTAMRSWALLAMIIAFLPMVMWLVARSWNALRNRGADSDDPTRPTARPSTDPTGTPPGTHEDLVSGGIR